MLTRFDSNLGSGAAAALASFDQHRSEILKIAMSVYAEGRQTIYLLN